MANLVNVEGIWGLFFWGVIMLFFGIYSIMIFNVSDYFCEYIEGSSFGLMVIIYFMFILLVIFFMGLIGLMVFGVIGVIDFIKVFVSVVDNILLMVIILVFIVFV